MLTRLPCRKQTITIQTWELEALHARIRETEERLKLQAAMAAGSNADKLDTTLDSFGAGSTFDQDDSASSPISESYPSEEGYTDASTAPSTTSNEDRPGDEDTDDVDCKTIREVDPSKDKEAEVQNNHNR